VLGVLAVHAGAGWAQGGWVTLVAFFVLSGYLITALLLNEWDKRGRISLPNFYLRRARRLLPALFLVLVAILIYEAVASHPIGTQHLHGLVAGTVFYYADFQASRGHVPLFSLLAHSYSLSIEEQFYFLWPLLLGLLLRMRADRRVLALVTLALSIPPVMLRQLMWHGSGSAVRLYYAPDTRYDALLLGCALAIWLSSPDRRPVPRSALSAAAAISVLGLGALFVGTDWHSEDTLRLWMTFAAVFSTVVLAVVVLAPEHPVSRVLAFTPFVRIGQVSYGIYLWHWPIFMIFNASTLGLPWWQTQLVRLVLTGVMATGSYVLVEQRFLRRNKGESIAPVRTAVAA